MKFEEILVTFENDDIKEYAKSLIEDFPEYFWKVPASSTGKYHPSYSLGDGGLYRHTVALCRIMNYILGLECIQNLYDSRERDLMRVAGIIHDSFKSGTNENYEKSKYTMFDHPIQASKFVLNHKGIPDNEINLVANAVASHMGQWNKDNRSKAVLPKPESGHQILLHVCDYLASRKDIILLFDEQIPAPAPVSINTFRIPFGKHSGTLFKDLPKAYVEWMKTQDFKGDILHCIDEYLKEGVNN